MFIIQPVFLQLGCVAVTGYREASLSLVFRQSNNSPRYSF